MNSSKTPKKIKLTEGTRALLEAIYDNNGITFNELKKLGKFAPSQLSSLLKNGLIKYEDAEVKVTRVEQVKLYFFTEEALSVLFEDENE